MKPINLTDKEIRRASGGLTIIVRRQAAGGYMVAAVVVETGMPALKPSFVERSEVAKTVKSELRMIDKCGFNCPMASASRDRFFCTP